MQSAIYCIYIYAHFHTHCANKIDTRILVPGVQQNCRVSGLVKAIAWSPECINYQPNYVIKGSDETETGSIYGPPGPGLLTHGLLFDRQKAAQIVINVLRID